jgi:hypothetical protein
LRLSLAALLALAATPALAASLSGPLAPAAKGESQCFGPDLAARTCQSMSTYRLEKGGISDVATILISKSPVIVMTTVAPVRIEGERVCGPIRAEDIAAASFTVDGRPADAEQTSALDGKLTDAMKDLFGHDICVAFTRNGDGFLATSTMDGVPRRDEGQKAIWVSPTDGYRVAP